MPISCEELAQAINRTLGADTSHKLLRVVPFAGKFLALFSTGAGLGIPDGALSSALRDLHSPPYAFRRVSCNAYLSNSNDRIYVSLIEIEIEGEFIHTLEWVSPDESRYTGAYIHEEYGDILKFDKMLLSRMTSLGAIAFNVGDVLITCCRHQVTDIGLRETAAERGTVGHFTGEELRTTPWNIKRTDARAVGPAGLWQLGISQLVKQAHDAMVRFPDAAVAELIAAQLSTEEHLELLSILVAAKSQGRSHVDALISRVCPRSIEMIDRTTQPTEPQTTSSGAYAYVEAC